VDELRHGEKDSAMPLLRAGVHALWSSSPFGVESRPKTSLPGLSRKWAMAEKRSEFDSLLEIKPQIKIFIAFFK
jgi:hypothetical protein